MFVRGDERVAKVQLKPLEFNSALEMKRMPAYRPSSPLEVELVPAHSIAESNLQSNTTSFTPPSAFILMKPSWLRILIIRN